MPVEKRYLRNIEALTEDECLLLAEKHVAVVGCGGLGGLVVEALARIGVRHLRLIDADIFDETNLNRQVLCTEATVGLHKAEVAKRRILEIDGKAEPEAIVSYLDKNNAADLVHDMDCVVDCLDTLESRFWLAHACQSLGIPIVYGAIAGWFGQVCTVYPGDASFVSIYGEPFGTSQHERLGSLPFAAHATAAVQSAEVVKVLLERPGQIRNRLLMIDLLDGSMDDVELA
ncbi:ThiF family adenylyltransferase [uncultured Slackia sp.]|uniref:HesA/MoeB/ThiF family protein n=1 Tax=uncultured Slackia sp. TaxID=665903 RepID=UPI0025F8862B|nr:ThiF family adenylyltransferase [uncultured Slackia sp.]